MSVNVETSGDEDLIGRLNDSFFQSQSKFNNIDSNLLSPTDEILKKFEPYNNFIKMGHANTVSIPKNRDDMEIFLNETGMDIFATSETNIHKNTPKSVFWNSELPFLS